MSIKYRYTEVIAEIRTLIGDLIYFDVDGIKNSCGRYIANVLISCLNIENPRKSYLKRRKQVDKTNNCTIILAID